MRRERMGGLDVVIAGGTDREGGGDGPVVILLHGFGAPGEDLAPLWRVLDVPREMRFVFPSAPLALPGFAGGRAWWLIDLERIQELMTGARGHDDERARKVVLGGFSQGAMLACDVALRREKAVDALVMLSGTLIAADEWTQLAPRRRGLRVLQSHGHDDPLLPFAAAERLRDLLAASGLDVEFVPFRGGHEIPDGVLERLGAFLRAV